MPTPSADLILTGATVWPGAGHEPQPGAVAVSGGRIVRLGTDDDVIELTGPRTQRRHLPGRLVLPGFQDAHVHPPFGGRNLLTVDLAGLGGREAYLAAIRAYAESHPDEPWIVGGGWSMDHFPGGTPLKEDLDSVVPDRPVFLFNRDVHGAWVNSVTLQRAGITAQTPDPPDGRIERAPLTGEPAGTLHEGAAYSLNDRLIPRPSQREWEDAILAAQRHLHAYGITGWQDAWVTPDTQDAYLSLAGSGALTARVVGALWWERDRGLEQIDDFVHRRTLAADGFHPTTVKIMVDGVLENYTGALLEPYCDGCGGHTDNSGIAFVPPDVLDAALVRLDALGFQVHMHAIGDRAVRMALDAVEAARRANGATDNRHHIAHLQVVHPDDIPRFGRLGVTANCQAFWARSEPQLDELTSPFLGPERAAGQYPFRALAAHGAELAMGSDWAVTTADVLQEVEVAVRRVDPEHRDKEPFLPEQRLTLSEALSAFTAGSARVNHDDDAGLITEGARADIAVVDHDLFGLDRPPVGDCRVELTVAAGRVVHDRAS